MRFDLEEGNFRDTMLDKIVRNDKSSNNSSPRSSSLAQSDEEWSRFAWKVADPDLVTEDFANLDVMYLEEYMRGYRAGVVKSSQD